MIQLVLDTNILVSAGITAGGDCDRILQAVLRGEIGIVVSPGIVEEYLEVLSRSKFTRYGFPPAWIRILLRSARHLPADPEERPEGPDPDDRLFLAVGQQVGILVTGNLKDFPAEGRGAAIVFSPGEFLAWLGASAG